jgi:hypothetical protein
MFSRQPPRVRRAGVDVSREHIDGQEEPNVADPRDSTAYQFDIIAERMTFEQPSKRTATVRIPLEFSLSDHSRKRTSTGSVARIHLIRHVILSYEEGPKLSAWYPPSTG